MVGKNQAETTHQKWPKRLRAETTQAGTTRAETTQGRNDSEPKLLWAETTRYHGRFQGLFATQSDFVKASVLRGSGTPRPKTISARDSSARTFRPIFQSGTARPILVGLLGPFFYYFFFWGGGGGGGGNLLFYSV